MKNSKSARLALLLLTLVLSVGVLTGCAGLFPIPDQEPTDAPTTHVHTPEADDGDCTTAVKCTTCELNAIEAKAAHVPGDDDGDCTTAIKCAHCDQIAVAACDAHEANEDDGDCTTAITCVNCPKVVIEAKDAHTPGEDDGDCTTAIPCANENCKMNATTAAEKHTATVIDCTVEVKCDNCDQIANPARDAHVPGADDGDCTTPVKCQYCDQIVIEAKTPIALTIPTFENGTVVANGVNFGLGDTVVLTVTPADGYAQQLYIDGEAIILDYTTGNTFSFVVEKDSYEITGSFVEKLNWFWTEGWNLINQGHGIAHAPAHPEGTQRTGDLVPEKGVYNGVSVLFKDVTNGDQKEFAIVLKTHFVGGLKSEVRLIDRDDNGRYCLQAMGDSFSSWDTFYWLSAEENAAVVNGEGVWYSMIRQDDKIYLYINDRVATIIDLSTQSITAETEINEIKIQTYNFSHELDVAYRFHEPAATDAPAVEVNIGAFENGTVTANKESFKAGDIVTLTITPANGYAQKLYINGEALVLSWKSNTYTFVAEEGKTYEITGTFEPVINIAPKDANRWYSSNQAHGILNTYYPANNDSWWVDIKGEYSSVSVTAKNFLSTEESKDDGGSIPGYHIILRMELDNGKTYAFRIYNDKGTYAVSCTAESGSVTGWGSWKNINALADAITGDGIEFKIERVSANVIDVSVNGNVLFSYTMADVTEENKVVSVGIDHKGNKGCYVEIPFEVVPVA